VWHDTADDSVGAWYPDEVWPHPGRVLAAHNAHGFDRFAAERYGFDAAAWIDTAQLARKVGLPGSLDALGSRWLDIPKDKVASKFTKSLSSVKRPATCTPSTWRGMSPESKRASGTQPAIDHAALTRVVSYCASDVAIMSGTWDRLREWIDVDAAAEGLDRLINDRGVCFDSILATRLIGECDRLRDVAVEECVVALGYFPGECEAAARSPQQFCSIVGTDDARADTVADVDHPLAAVRRAIASPAKGKLLAGLARVHADGRLRDTLVYYGAHTGRWSARGMQLHNMSRPEVELDVDTFAEEVIAGRRCTKEEVDAMVRSTITASPGNLLVVSDFSAIEAVTTAWCARDEAALDVFRSDREVYRIAAAAIFEIEYDEVTSYQRQVGKVSELACGYGGGVGALTGMAAKFSLDLSGVDPQGIVDRWRALHIPIVQLWRNSERAFRSAMKGRNCYAGPCEYVLADDGGAVACFLPSGRPIVYPDVRLAGRSLSYLGKRGRAHLYGGKLVENSVQAMCRDLMSDATIAAENEMLDPVFTVHDEIVCDVPIDRAHTAYDRLREIMTTLPAWAAGLPLEAKGWLGKRYRK